jgi:hypothetical protein
MIIDEIIFVDYYLLFCVMHNNISFVWICHHYRWRATKFRLMLGAWGFWAGRDLYRATPALTRALGFSSLIRRTAPLSRLSRYTRVCGGPILTRIAMGNFCREIHKCEISSEYAHNLFIENIFKNKHRICNIKGIDWVQMLLKPFSQ